MNVSSARSEPLPVIELVDDVVACLEAGKAVRRDVGKNGRLHIDRPLPFLCLHLTGGSKDLAARDIASAHASYLIASSIQEAAP